MDGTEIKLAVSGWAGGPPGELAWLRHYTKLAKPHPQNQSKLKKAECTIEQYIDSGSTMSTTPKKHM